MPDRSGKIPARQLAAAEKLLEEVRACAVCADDLPYGPRPAVQLHPAARILVAAQAPGRKVHDTGLPFNDASGDRLRDWMGIDRETFYDPLQVATVPMGFCYPGRGKAGDMPPRTECASLWRERLLAVLPNVELTLVIGQYAQQWHLPGAGRTLTEVVQRWRDFAPRVVPLPHPSPRNNLWLRRNPWFEAEVVPFVRQRVAGLLAP